MNWNYVMLTCIHGRHSLAAKMLAHYSGLGISIVAAISPADISMANTLKSLGVEYIVSQNSPVSQKWQLGLSFLREIHGPDKAVMTMGSDDFASREYLEAANEMILENLYIGPNAIHMYNPRQQQIGIWVHPHTTAGAGRVYSAGALRTVRHTLWPLARDSGLDTLANRFLSQHNITGAVVPMTGDRVIVDCKGSSNIHKWQDFDFETVLEAKQRRYQEVLIASGAIYVTAEDTN